MAYPRPELTVTDIKQYFYCPRIVYFLHVLPVDRRPTAKMAYGKEEHLRLDALEKRRRLARYGLAEGERRFHVFLHSERWNLAGLLDLLIIAPGGYFPVEFKYSARLGRP
ncbi:MAG: CRISPR-associated protein Cas4, partial [Bacillota bacterium]|nr:CRISPR-associated protein Cas4 [Bacillota bacterium]